MPHSFALACLLLSVAASQALAAGDPAAGRKLHDQQCIACHAAQFGGDGSQMYLRADHKVRSPESLKQRIAVCNTFAKAGWFPDEEEHVAAYLAQRFYKFK
jgi:mono/diheme cytochrome c family protein